MFLWRCFSVHPSKKRKHRDGVKWIGKFSLLLKSLRDARMDMLPLSALSEEQRENQYLDDVIQENAE